MITIDTWALKCRRVNIVKLNISMVSLHLPSEVIRLAMRDYTYFDYWKRVVEVSAKQ